MSETDREVCKFVKRKRPNLRQAAETTPAVPTPSAITTQGNDSDSDNDQEINNHLEEKLNDYEEDGESLLIMKKRVKTTGTLTFQTKKKESRKTYSLDNMNSDDDFESRTGESSVFTSYKSDKSSQSAGPKVL
jgi:hypothetical protein